MNILVTLNSNYIQPLTVMLKSMTVNNPADNFDLYVAHSSLTSEDFDRINKSVDLTRTKIHSIVIDEKILANAPVLKRLSKETYYRLLALEFMPKNTDRVLYIDPDTVILRSLKKLYNTDMGNNLIAAAGHTKGFIEFLNRKRLHLNKNTRYINAGIILMNIKEMRKEYCVDDIFRYIEKNRKKLYLGDQDVFNGMFTGRIKVIDELLYNLDEKTLASAEVNLEWVKNNTVIIHYNGQYKPWKEGYKGIMQGFYYHYDKTVICTPKTRIGILTA